MSLDGKKLSVMNELDPDQQGICSATLSIPILHHKDHFPYEYSFQVVLVVWWGVPAWNGMCRSRGKNFGNIQVY